MSENLKAFWKKVSTDEKLLERLRSAAGHEQVLEMAKEIGMELSMADIAPQECEMTEGELETLNGGLLVQEYRDPDIGPYIIPSDNKIEWNLTCEKAAQRGIME